MEPRQRGPSLQALNLNPFLLLRSATAATVPPAAPAGEGGPPAPPPNLTSNRRLQQTQAQVDEVSACVCVCERCKMMGLAKRCGSPSWLEGDDSLRLWVLGQRPTVSHLCYPVSMHLKGYGVLISCARLGCASWGRCALVIG